jgi:3-methyl-2-oxobutanoate hydroxymethyltransferase
MLGISGFYPKFVKKYADLSKMIENAVAKYSREVKNKKFPNKKNSY